MSDKDPSTKRAQSFYERLFAWIAASAASRIAEIQCVSANDQRRADQRDGNFQKTALQIAAREKDEQPGREHGETRSPPMPVPERGNQDEGASNRRTRPKQGLEPFRASDQRRKSCECEKHRSPDAVNETEGGDDHSSAIAARFRRSSHWSSIENACLRQRCECKDTEYNRRSEKRIDFSPAAFWTL